MKDRIYRFSIALMKDLPESSSQQKNRRLYDAYLAKDVIDYETENVSLLPHGIAYIGAYHAGQPSWANTLHSLFGIQTPIPDNISNRAVVFTTIQNHVLAILFGYGRAMLNAQLICRDFGRQVALNILSNEDIRSITSFSISDAIFLSQTQASEARNSMEFGVESSNGIVKQIVGKPADEDYGTSVSGNDVLSISFPLKKVDDISEKLSLLLSAYHNKEGRQAGLEWVDQISEVRDRELKSELDEILCNHISGQNQDSGVSVNNLSAAPPIILDWETAGLFYLGTEHRANRRDSENYYPQFQPYIDLCDYIQSCKSCTDIISKLHRDHLYTLSTSEDIPSPICTAYRTLVCEIVRSKESFILIDGKWFNVAASLYEEINNYLTGSELQHVDLSFPDCKKGTSNSKYEDEGKYNERLSSNMSYVLLDKSHFGIKNGPKQIEVCDLFDANDKRFIHVKKDNGSSVLSHLFSQGAVAAQCYSDDQDFRDQFNAQIPNSIFKQRGKPTTEEFCVTYTIITKKYDGDHLPEASKRLERINLIPFFSRLNLMQRTRELRRMGYRVQLGFIGTEQ